MTKIDIGIRLPPKSSRIWDSLYVWKAKGEEILAKIKRAREKLSGN